MNGSRHELAERQIRYALNRGWPLLTSQELASQPMKSGRQHDGHILDTAHVPDQFGVAYESRALLPLEVEVNRHPSEAEAWFRLGSTAKVLALKELNAFLDLSLQSYRVSQLRAELALAQGDEDQAIQHYRAAIAANPTAVQLHLAIANIHMSRHQYAQAIPEYEAELGTDASALTALERIGEAYAELNDPSHAEAYLKRAIAIDPHAFDAYQILGKVCYERADYKAAVANYLEAVSNTAKPPSALLFQLSKAYRKLGNTAEADRWLARFQRQLASEHQEVQQRFQEATQP